MKPRHEHRTTLPGDATASESRSVAGDVTLTVGSGEESGIAAHGASTEPELPGRYEDLGLIGGGSFGEVRRVRDTLLERVVAMKLLRAQHAEASHVRRRFLVEAQITAGLQHPGIVAVYDRGQLEDGRLWFTMKEVRGRTLRDVLAELHAHKDAAEFAATPSGWTFRRVVDAFARIAQAVAYAHSLGVVHRDLKPDNLMVGEHGEVLVMDWGLARRVGVSDPDQGGIGGPPQEAGAAGLTHLGDVLGTPAYMPPEQARGDTRLHGPASDVYSLGGVLYCVLSGKAPRRRGDAGVHRASSSGGPVPVREAAAGGPPVPGELCDIVDRAMQPAIEDRYESAEALARDVVAWLDGVRRQEQALAALEKARAVEPEIAALRANAKDAEARARVIQSDVRPYDPVEKKRPVWELEDEAARLGREAALAEATWMEAVQGALSVDPDLAEAHAMLADHHRGRLIDAERAHRDEDAARSVAMLRIHDRGRHAAFLRGDGAMTLVTDPPGAEVIVERYVLHDRRLVPVREQVMGPTPLVKVPLKRGSYLLRVRAPGRAEVRYPVLVERDGHWDGVAPGESEPYPIVLPKQGELGPDDCHVPAGWSWIGGEVGAADTLPSRRTWVDAFVVRRFPVTNEEYIEFLNDLVATGREAEALEACPRAESSMPQAPGELLFARDAAGRFGLMAVAGDSAGQLWRSRWPVVLVSWYASVAYARWAAERSGTPWRLPNEIEREKAARGADGRHYPWGDHFDATWACVLDTYARDARRDDVDRYPLDESPYGVRGLAGNVRDWCENVWTHEGPEVVEGRLRPAPPASDAQALRAARGGAFLARPELSRAEARYASQPGARWRSTGIRLARSLRW